jgi:hemoglobin
MTMSIYERHGGFSTVRKVVSEFYDRMLDSDLVAHHFTDVDMARLIDHQTKFISFLLGGPASYNDDHLQRVHAHMSITLQEFDEVVAILSETLEDFDFSSSDIAYVEQGLRQRESVIVTVR